MEAKEKEYKQRIQAQDLLLEDSKKKIAIFKARCE
jgi:hypothetical protein